MPVVINGVTSYDVSPEEFAKSAVKLAQTGCSAIGGCCGTTPEHLKAVVESCNGMSINRPEVSRKSFVSSRTKTVFFDDKTVLIGERINPTGKPKLKAALKENNLEYLCL
jgi:5-methyltetrahydrofolate--homocysteine methyltransferase